MRPRSSVLAAGSLVPCGNAQFLPETPATAAAPATGSILTAAGKPANAELQTHATPARLSPAYAVLGAFSRFVDWLMAGAERARQRELERYLGKSVDLYDLERRLQELERGRQPIFGSYV